MALVFLENCAIWSWGNNAVLYQCTDTLIENTSEYIQIYLGTKKEAA